MKFILSILLIALAFIQIQAKQSIEFTSTTGIAGLKGNFVAEYEVYQTTAPDSTHGAVSVNFELSQAGKHVSGASLVAKVSRRESGGTTHLFTVPVSFSADNRYSVSWALLDREAKSGRYNIDIYSVDSDLSGSLLTINVDFEGSSAQILPFRTEAVVVFLLAVGFLVFSFRKAKIEAPRKVKST